jgi:hypothetical protein
MKNFVVVTVAALLLFVSLPASAANMGLKRLNGQVGLLFPSTTGISYNTSFLIGAGADFGEITDNLNLVPSLSYWIMSADPEGGAVSGLDASASNFQIAADVQYYLKDVKGLYFGGGLSINFNSITIDYNVPGYYSGSTSASGTDIGIDLLGGYEMPLGKTSTGFAQAKYNIISDLNTFSIILGVWFDMK